MPRNDPPSSMRMRFGYHQAADAGVPFIAPRSGGAMGQELREQQASKILRQMIEEDERLGPEIARLIRRNGLTAQEVLAELRPKDRPTFESNS